MMTKPPQIQMLLKQHHRPVGSRRCVVAKRHHPTKASSTRSQRQTTSTHSTPTRQFGTDGRMFSSHPPGHPEQGEVYQAITTKITTCPDIQNVHHFDLVNESDQHSGPRWRESHFKLTLVADLPANCKMLLSKHRFINKVLEAEIPQIHAISLHIYNKQQWVEQFGETAPASPLCTSAPPKRREEAAPQDV